MSLRDRIDAFCAVIGIWGASILKYFDDMDIDIDGVDGVFDLSDLFELFEFAELSEVLALPLLALGIAGSGRVLWTAYRSIANRPPPSRHFVRHF
jgi:hypothetical protein